MMLILPATAAQVWAQVVNSTCALLPPKMNTPEAGVMLLAIGGQESGFKTRVQYGNGPAHGLWQFERGGGVKGVMAHPASKAFAQAVCVGMGVPFDAQAVWEALAYPGQGDRLACAFARLLLWTGAGPLPSIGAQDDAYAYYEALWRPGKPDKSRWPAAYQAACDAVRGPPV